MGDSSPTMSVTSRQRKKAVLALPRLTELRSNVGAGSISYDAVKMRGMSPDSPSVRKKIAGVEMDARLLNTKNVAPRKYSENLSSYRGHSTANGVNIRPGSHQEKRRLLMRRSWSLVHNDKSEVIIDQDILEQHEERNKNQTTFTLESSGNKSILDDMSWSRYWYDARNQTNVRNYSFKGEFKRNRKKTRKENIVCEILDLNENPQSVEISEKVEDDISAPVNKLSLEERLEKIEKERGFLQYTKSSNKSPGKIS